MDVAITWLNSKPSSWRVADLGCGDAQLAKQAKQTVYSFDLVSTVPGVVACNMANLPLQDRSIDVAVFSLSLMGVDYGDFLEEAARVVNETGWIWIAEVQSRFIDDKGKSVMEAFVKTVEALGFVLKHKDVSNSHFLLLVFQGKRGRKRAVQLEWPSLRACQYKKR